MSYTVMVRDPLRTQQADPTKVENGWYTREYDMVLAHNSGGLICHNWGKGPYNTSPPIDYVMYGPGFWALYYENKETA